MPLLAGRASSNFRQASRPPADAPIATIGKSAWLLAERGLRIQSGRAGFFCCGRLPSIRVTFLVERNSNAAPNKPIAQIENYCDVLRSDRFAPTWRRALRV